MGKLKSKRVIRESPSFKDVRDWYEKNLHPDKLDIEDEEVYKHVYDESRFASIFQFSSAGAQKLIQKFKPRTINDIAVATSIYRPGPLNAKVDKIYLENKENIEEVKKSMHPLVWECLQETHGCITGDTKVLTENGEIELKQIVENNMVGIKLPSFNIETGEIENDVIVGVADQGVKETLTIVFDDETKIQLTQDHNILTTIGWKRADELTTDDEIISIEKNIQFTESGHQSQKIIQRK